MVFSSVPVYLDPPNWQQHTSYHHHHQQQQQQGVSNDQNHPHQLPPLPPPPPQAAASGGAGALRPGSMADRARSAKIPHPEAALKCPRCESTNTKFCYFNNYNLSQPRHFCKTCRRYWTKGGALRNVPVGGGCRRNNKKAKSNNSSAKSSPGSSTERQIGSNSEIVGHLPQQASQFPVLGSLHNLTQYGLGNLGLNFSQSDMGTFNIGNSSSTRAGIQQFPFFDSPAATNLFPFQTHEGGVDQGGSSTRVSQHDPMKSEEINPTSSRSFSGVPDQNNQYWGGNNWSDLSNVNSSTTYNLL
ncbi:hypothetical protein ACFE04_014756 [Oxalis oulophora]